MSDSVRRLAILGTRGIPASHGGFETFAQRLALHLVEQGWEVTVTCQTLEKRPRQSTWHGVSLLHLPAAMDNPLGTILYDLRSVLAILKRQAVVLSLGYNTAIFNLVLRAANISNIINMDGIEWQRTKWSVPARAWLYANERIARRVADHLIADHPVVQARIGKGLPSRQVSCIPYGADRIEAADVSLLQPFELEPDRFALMVGRPEPDNSILEIVRAFSRRRRGVRLCVLGQFRPEHAYHRAVLDAASAEVVFPGAIYDPARLASLRFFARLYLHGHRVGGTNPSLVEALGAGNAVLARDNPFNRWVAGDAMRFFDDEDSCAASLDELLAPDADLSPMQAAARQRHAEAFTWPDILERYEYLLSAWT